MNRRTWLALCACTSGLTATTGIAGEAIRRTYVRKYCHLPCYDYRTSFPTNPRSQVSTLCLLLPTADDAISPVPPVPSGVATSEKFQTKLISLSRSFLENDHCRLEQFTVMIVADGTWMLNFRAIQDPSLVGEQQRPAFERYARNFLHVVVRGVGTLPAPDINDDAPLGKPEYFRLELAPIRLEKRTTHNLRRTGNSSDIRRFFLRVSQVEVDLSYE